MARNIGYTHILFFKKQFKPLKTLIDTKPFKMYQQEPIMSIIDTPCWMITPKTPQSSQLIIYCQSPGLRDEPESVSDVWLWPDSKIAAWSSSQPGEIWRERAWHHMRWLVTRGTGGTWLINWVSGHGDPEMTPMFGEHLLRMRELWC